MGSHARQHARSRPPDGLVADWRARGIALGVLRAFLGVTFVYAGIQKLADPNFLHAGTPDYVGSQLRAFAVGSPIGWLLRMLDHLPVPTGIGIALLEIGIGVGTLLGVGRYALPLAGLGVNVILFLSATWHVHPYFLGSDSVYAVAWLAYVGGMWEQDRRRVPARRAIVSSRDVADPGRRAVLRGALVGGATLLVAGAARALIGRNPEAAAKSGLASPAPGPHNGDQRTVDGRNRNPSSPPTSGRAHGQAAGGRTIATLDALPVGGALPFAGPGGQPCALFRLGPQEVAAFSRICTHAGCEVGYDSASRLLVCPCHGAEFDPSRGAVPVAGPAPVPLPSVRVVIDQAQGTVVLPG